MHTELEELWTVFYHNFSKYAASATKWALLVGCIGVQSHSLTKVCVKVLAWVSIPFEPECVIVKNIATDHASQEENANELLLIVLAKKSVWVNYNWLC